MKKLAFLFDVDGVIGDTPQEEAWKAAAVKWGIIPEEFNFTSFYSSSIAGEPGMTGAYNILDSLHAGSGIPYFKREGITSQDAKDKAIKQFREVKQGYLFKYIEEGKFKVFDDIGKIILEAKRQGVPIAAVSSSESASRVLSNIDAAELSERVNIPCMPSGSGSLYDVFDTTALGALTYWKKGIDKINHYAMAYGKLLGKTDRQNLDVVVFEDATKGIAAATKLGFYTIGISRKSNSGMNLSSEKELLEAGATLAYDESKLGYNTIMRDLEKVIEK